MSEKKDDLLPSRKVKSSYKSRNIFIVFACFLLICAIIAIPLSYVNYLRKSEEGRVKCFFDSNNILTSAIGKFSAEAVNDAESALNAVKALKEQLGYPENFKEYFKSEPPVKTLNGTIYRFNQIYDEIPVIGGYMTVCTDENNFVSSWSGKYIYNASSCFSSDEIKYAKENHNISTEDIYKITTDKKRVSVSINENTCEPVIYADKRGALTLGRRGRVTLNDGSNKDNYTVVMPIDIAALVYLGSADDIEKTEELFVDSTAESIAFSGPSAAVKYAISDIWRVCSDLNWDSEVGEKIKASNKTVNEYEYKTQNANGFFIPDSEKYESEISAEDNSCILSRIMYNVFLYCSNNNMTDFKELFLTSLKYMSGKMTFSDFRQALESAAYELEYSESKIDTISQCFDAAKLKKAYKMMTKAECDVPSYEPKAAIKAEMPNEYGDAPKNEIEKVLKLEKDYYEKNFDKEKSEAFLLDISHNGLPEMIVCDTSDWEGAKKITTKIYGYFDGMLKKIEERSASALLTGYDSLFVYTSNGRKYLYNYNPTRWGDMGTYSYEIYYFDENGKKQIYETDSIVFGDNVEESADEKKVSEYISKSLDYVKGSKLIYNTFSKSDFYNKDFETGNYTCDGYASSGFDAEYDKWTK